MSEIAVVVDGITYIGDDPEGFAKEVKEAGGASKYLAKKGLTIKNYAFPNATVRVVIKEKKKGK